jgi:outer membrane protein assembly factor BamB
MNQFRLFCTIVVTFVSCFGLSRADDWNQWRGPNRNGVAPTSPQFIEKLPATGLKPVWLSADEIPSARAGGWASPIVADGCVYLFTHGKKKVGKESEGRAKYPYLAPEKRTGMTDEEYEEYEQNRRDEQETRSKAYKFFEVTYCLDATTGKTKWTAENVSVYTRFPHSGSPIVIDGRLLVLTAGRTAKCLNAKDGKELWTTKLPGEFRDQFWQSSFAVVDGVACVMCGSLYGLDVKSGEVLWSGDERETKGDHTSPVVWTHADKNYFVANGGGDTICVEPRSGKEIWRAESEAQKSTPVVVGDLLITYGSSRKKGLRCYKMSATSVEHMWTFQGAADSGSSPVVVGNAVYVQGERRLACVDIESGKAQWTATLDISNPRYTSLVAADNKIIYAFDGVLCFAADTSDYKQLMNAKIDGEGTMAEEEDFRKILGIAELEKTAEGQKQAERLWRSQFGKSGPLPCTTPAIVDGRVYFRLKDRVACYDFRKQ